MRTTQKISILAAAALAAGLASGQASSGGPWSISWYTIDGGGGTSVGGDWKVSGTIGQPDAGSTMTGGDWAVTGGFWAGISGAQPECRTDVTTTNTNPGDPGYGVPDGTSNGNDLSYFVEQWLGASPTADFTTTNTNPGDAGYGVPDGVTNGNDLSFYVELWLAGCA